MPPTRARNMTTRTAQRRLDADKALQAELEPLMGAPVEKYKGGATFYKEPGRSG